jgi:DNA-binding NtrC family response regulator
MKPRVLIADSDFEMLEIYEDVLPNIGYAVRTAVDGLECWRKVRSFRPDVLVIDRELRWGGADGVLALMKEEFFCVSVVLTTDDDRTNGAIGQPHGIVVRCLQKPFGFHALMSAIRSALDERDGQQGVRQETMTKV